VKRFGEYGLDFDRAPDPKILEILSRQKNPPARAGSGEIAKEARPKTCRDFPHVAIGTHSLGSRPSSHGRWAALCPIIFNALESYKHLTGYHSRPTLATPSKPSV